MVDTPTAVHTEPYSPQPPQPAPDAQDAPTLLHQPQPMGTLVSTSLLEASDPGALDPGTSLSEMLPLSEFLAKYQSSPHDPVGYQDMREDLERDGEHSHDPPSYQSPRTGYRRRYSPPPTPPPPAQMLSNQIGRIPITSAAGEFTGFQHYTSPAKEVALQEDQSSGLPPVALPVVPLNIQRDRMTFSDSGVTGHHDDHDEDEFLNQRRPIRNYKVFPGRNMFFCRGRIMTSRDFPAFLIAIMLLLVPTGLFHGFTSPYLWHRLSPAAPIVQAYLFVVAFSSMLKTSWTDPGVIPRGIDSDPPLDPPLELDINSASFYPPSGLPRLKEVQVGIYTVRLKYCDTCKIYRPPRCSHCRQCDNCVEDEDHHCIWLNNCIGRRNYRYFLIFVSTAAVYAFLTAALCLTHLLLLYHDRQRMSEGPGQVSFTNDAIAKAPVAALVMVYATVMGLAVGSLASYHFWLATMNPTVQRSSAGHRRAATSAVETMLSRKMDLL
ncbi:Eukaryotic peptide chain release factor GTP-binding subunit [Mortierella antarctica]|nr:Eukaryotic peptide chain release factor GTP-binding subunit [Mortierella antarctica]